MENPTEKMIAAITEIAETDAEIWDVFDICDKHELSPAEADWVTIMFEESRQEMIKLIEEEKVEAEEVVKVEKESVANEHFKPMSINENTTGFGA